MGLNMSILHDCLHGLNKAGVSAPKKSDLVRFFDQSAAIMVETGHLKFYLLRIFATIK